MTTKAEQIRQLYDQGMSRRDIAAMLESDKDYVDSVLCGARSNRQHSPVERRCPGCGGKVIGRCRLCEVRAMA